jgi:hypothetical protein
LHKVIAATLALCNKGRVKPASKKRGDGVLPGQRRLPLGVPRKHSVREEYRRCGDESCRTCREGPGHGPYRYAVWRDGAKVMRKYLGRA